MRLNNLRKGIGPWQVSSPGCSTDRHEAGRDWLYTAGEQWTALAIRR